MSFLSLLNSEKLRPLALGNSLWTYNVGLSCCSLEFMSVTGPRYDWERFGALPCEHASDADLLIVSGPVPVAMEPELRRLYDQMRGPKYVIAAGSCANTGGMFGPSSTVKGGVDRIIPVDIYVPGCPPRPEALMHALLRLRERIMGTATATPTVRQGGIRGA